MNFKKKIIRILLASFLLFSIFGQYPIVEKIYAKVEPATNNSQNKVFLEDVPGMEELASNTGEGTDPTKMIITYLNWLIRLSVVIGSILAVVYIVIGGVEYMTTTIYSKKSAGKEKIVNAIMGIIFLISGYLIFEEINPNILNLNFGYKPSKASEQEVKNETSTSIVSNPMADLDDDTIIFGDTDPVTDNAGNKATPVRDEKGEKIKYSDIKDMNCLEQAILMQESSGGTKKGMGSCSLGGKDPTFGNGQKAKFITLMNNLGRDPQTTKVSCAGGAGGNHGGAMGPMQFIPETWCRFACGNGICKWDKYASGKVKCTRDPWKTSDWKLAAHKKITIDSKACGGDEKSNVRCTAAKYFGGSGSKIDTPNKVKYADEVWTKYNGLKSAKKCGGDTGDDGPDDDEETG